MKKIIFFLALSAAVFVCSVAGSEEVESLRGGADIPAASTPSAGAIEWEVAVPPIPVASVHQPPLIPHSVIGLNVTLEQNDCLGCHGVEGSGAPKPHKSHYIDRDEKATKKISSRWYFCNQCHVGQVDAKPLLENTFNKK